jgi:prepilin-type N-terminal cleavage/methylation domain-containing protein
MVFKDFPTFDKKGEGFMKNQKGFSVIELLIVVAIISIIAAIVLPTVSQTKRAANESGAIQGLRTIGSAEVAYAALHDQKFGTIDELVRGNYLDARFKNGFNGYQYISGFVHTTVVGGVGFNFLAVPTNGRYIYGIDDDQVIRFQGLSVDAPEGTLIPKCGESYCRFGDPVDPMK